MPPQITVPVTNRSRIIRIRALGPTSPNALTANVLSSVANMTGPPRPVGPPSQIYAGNPPVFPCPFASLAPIRQLQRIPL